MATDNPDASAIVTELSHEAKLKLEIIESLLEPCDRASYRQRLKDAAKKLGKSVRTKAIGAKVGRRRFISPDWDRESR